MPAACAASQPVTASGNAFRTQHFGCGRCSASRAPTGSARIPRTRRAHARAGQRPTRRRVSARCCRPWSTRADTEAEARARRPRAADPPSGRNGTASGTGVPSRRSCGHSAARHRNPPATRWLRSRSCTAHGRRRSAHAPPRRSAAPVQDYAEAGSSTWPALGFQVRCRSSGFALGNAVRPGGEASSARRPSAGRPAGIAGGRE